MQALGAAAKVFELIDRKPVISTDDGTEQPDEVKGHISFKNVCFSYPMRPDQPVLQVGPRVLILHLLILQRG